MDLNTYLLVFIGLVATLMGYLIWVQKRTIFIAGHRKDFKDKERLTKLVGQFIFGIGIFTTLIPLLIRLIGERIWWLFAAAVIGGAITVLVKAQRF